MKNNLLLLSLCLLIPSIAFGMEQDDFEKEIKMEKARIKAGKAENKALEAKCIALDAEITVLEEECALRKENEKRSVQKTNMQATLLAKPAILANLTSEFHKKSSIELQNILVTFRTKHIINHNEYEKAFNLLKNDRKNGIAYLKSRFETKSPTELATAEAALLEAVTQESKHTDLIELDDREIFKNETENTQQNFKFMRYGTYTLVAITAFYIGYRIGNYVHQSTTRKNRATIKA